MSSIDSFALKFVSLLLKLSVLAYLFATLFPFISDPGFESTFGSWSVRWLLIILLGAITLGVFVVSRSQFYIYGFFLVAIAAVYQLFNALFSPNIIVEVMLHFYVLSTAIYFLTRDLRHQRKHRGTHSKKTTDW
ncbi:MAG TPA: hypothetical protein PKE03_03030 [Bacteroidales bacterium]|nr:hypothetical protein [Bacteroidales bacterium]